MHERDILHEVGEYWVGRNRRCNAVVVYKTGATHSVSDSAYCNNADGLSIAIARANYLAKRDADKMKAQIDAVNLKARQQWAHNYHGIIPPFDDYTVSP